MQVRVTVEQTSTDNNQKTVIECEKDDINVEEAMSMLLRALIGHGYDKQAVASHFIELAEFYHKSKDEPQTDD